MTKGRPRKFNEQDALSRATVIFWQKGYRGTSLDDLTEAMQINRPSLYASFGDKEKLFLAAVDHYRETYIRPNVIKLLQAENLRTGLREFFQASGRLICGEVNPPGCLIACLLSENCTESRLIGLKFAEIIASADAAFTGLFERHKDELSERITPQAAAKLLTSTIHGVSIRARSGASQKDLVPIVDGLIKVLVND